MFKQFAETHQAYLSQWYLETPVVVTSGRYKELQGVQQLLMRAIGYFIRHYADYQHIFPLPENIRRVMEICSPYPYRIGTYRPDFLIEEDGQLRICEIGARFPLNGYFLSGIAEYIGQRRFPYRSYLEQPEYNRFLNYLLAYWGNPKHLYVLKGNDRPCDIKYYIPFFEAWGIKTEVVTPEQVASLPDLAGACVVNELNQMEMEQMDNSALENIAASNALNDMRTIFLIHDKRFLAVLSDPAFLSHCLTKEEVARLTPFLIPTYTTVQAPEIWEEARKNKAEWVLKHALLGKSEQVYTGRTCNQEEWEALFAPSVREAMVLQPFIHQQRIRSTIGGQAYHDYVVGTLLCFDHYFFGTGLFRASSFEITNRTDDRKMAPCFTDDYAGYHNPYIL